MPLPSPDIEYRPHPTYPNYRAGADGTIVGPSGKVLQPSSSASGGRLQINLREPGSPRSANTKKLYVSVMVCEAFHGPRPEGMYALHRDGDHHNTAPSNLYWGRLSERLSRHQRHRPSGEANGNARVTAADVREMRRAYAEDGVTQAQLGERFGLSRGHVGQILRGTRWQDLWPVVP